MIYTVTFNPSLDYIVSVKGFRPGATNRTFAEEIFPGGKGINVSLVLKNLGYESTALGFLAGFTGDEIAARLEKKGVLAEFIRVENGVSRINVKLRSDEETEINGMGPVMTGEDLEKLYRKLDELKDGDTLILAGSIPDSLPQTIYMDILEYLKDKDLRIAVDATKDLLVNVLPYRPFLIKPNHHELGEIFGVTVDTQEKAAEYGKKLHEMGARNVLVSMAGLGAVLIAEDGSIFATDVPKGKVLNSVGAGDSTVAGFLTGMTEQMGYAESFRFAVCCGSASAFSETMAERADAEKLLKELPPVREIAE